MLKIIKKKIGHKKRLNKCLKHKNRPKMSISKKQLYGAVISFNNH
jgi:hypothetical protein